MPRRPFSFLIAGAVVVADRVTKLAVQKLAPPWDTREVIPGFFNIVHTENPAAAFSLLTAIPQGWRRFFLVACSAAASALVAVLLWRDGARSRKLATGLALVLGGALGNLYDRAIPGTVTDFLDFYAGSFHWPAFNIADSAITTGACLILLDMLMAKRAPRKD
jgi:signal peptidase II